MASTIYTLKKLALWFSLFFVMSVLFYSRSIQFRQDFLELVYISKEISLCEFDVVRQQVTTNCEYLDKKLLRPHSAVNIGHVLGSGKSQKYTLVMKIIDSDNVEYCFRVYMLKFRREDLRVFELENGCDFSSSTGRKIIVENNWGPMIDNKLLGSTEGGDN